MASWWQFWKREKASNSHELFKEVYGGRVSLSGKVITRDAALRVAAVFCCARVIAEGIAQVPLKLMIDDAAARSKMPAKDHALYDVLAVKPNAWQTSFEFRETLGLHAAIGGNFYAFKNIVGGRIRELIPLIKVNPVKLEDGSLEYEVTGKDGSVKTFPASVIWHVKGPSWDSRVGLEALDLAREAIGIAIATEESTSRLQKNGIRPAGTYSVEGALDEKQYAALQKWLEKNAEPENYGKAMVLDRGAKWLNMQMSNVDAQHLETRKYQVEEICRFFRVMPIMIGYSDKASTYASAEQMFLAHVVHTLSPWYARIEQSIDANLLTAKERTAGLYSDFVEEGLLRGDMKTTSEVLAKYTERGIMTRNEARAKLDMNPLDGLDEPLTPVNLMGAAQNGEPNAQNA